MVRQGCCGENSNCGYRMLEAVMRLNPTPRLLPSSSPLPLRIEEIPHALSNEPLPTTLDVMACPEVHRAHTISNCARTRPPAPARRNWRWPCRILHSLSSPLKAAKFQGRHVRVAPSALRSCSFRGSSRSPGSQGVTLTHPRSHNPHCPTENLNPELSRKIQRNRLRPPLHIYWQYSHRDLLAAPSAPVSAFDSIGTTL